MKTTLSLFAACLAVLPLGSLGAVGAAKLPGQVALTGASSGCPASALNEAVVAVKLVLPAAGGTASKPVNRFRYNFRDAGRAADPVVTGEIHDFGIPGCTISFAGAAISYD